jgi:hypothetical protein
MAMKTSKRRQFFLELAADTRVADSEAARVAAMTAKRIARLTVAAAKASSSA